MKYQKDSIFKPESLVICSDIVSDLIHESIIFQFWNKSISDDILHKFIQQEIEQQGLLEIKMD